ncbi:pep-cterm sorting domain-containing protein [Anaeramoeba ignava]|uniref:Pep-cterm sorting domain-containing protein n=1 Tax=Anaeramoeba ignava TaxID=1746090 RepID=A0A9Q0LMZ4_ANAIG|nr:pep-cterm sorting domain-containing protein [Anaeramoeba ignava]
MFLSVTNDKSNKVTDYSELKKLSNDLQNLFQNQNQNQKEEESYFDFEIICEQNKTSFKTHKSILSSRSHYFKSLFKSKMKEYQENKLILKDVSSSILFSILNYFYSGKIEINLENVIEILVFSSKYLIDELIEICSNFIKNNLQFETIVDILKLSESMNFNQLLDSSYQFILDNFEEFIKTSFFLELEENHLNSILSSDDVSTNEFELFQSIIKWGKHKSNIHQKLEKEEKEKLQNQISNVIDKIRFIDFSKKELKDTLKEDLIPKQISQKLIQFQKLQNKKDENKIFSQKDGFNSKNWHEKCDNKGKTLVIIKTKDNFIFGGFTEIGWTTDKSKWRKEDREHFYGWIPDSNAFIFSLRNDKGDRKPEKFPIKKSREENSVYYHLDAGPSFGNMADIYINPIFQPGYSHFGNNYNLPNGIKYNTNEAKSYLTGSYNKWVVDELETYFI